MKMKISYMELIKRMKRWNGDLKEYRFLSKQCLVFLTQVGKVQKQVDKYFSKMEEKFYKQEGGEQ